MRRLTERGLAGALFRYQVMANIVGTLIIPLFVFTGIKIFTGHGKVAVEIFGVGHGYLYIVYLVTVGFLALSARLHPLWVLAMVAAGLIPGMTFVVEWWVVTRKIHPKLAADGPAETTERTGPPPTGGSSGGAHLNRVGPEGGQDVVAVQLEEE